MSLHAPRTFIWLQCLGRRTQQPAQDDVQKKSSVQQRVQTTKKGLNSCEFRPYSASRHLEGLGCFFSLFDGFQEGPRLHLDEVEQIGNKSHSSCANVA
jgi:hypothetical protein